MKPRIKPHILTVTALCAGLLSVSSCSRAHEKIIDDTRFFMGTVVEIKVSIDPARYSQARANDAINKAFDEIKRIEEVCSVFKDTSEISRINRLGKDEKLEITGEVFNLIRKTLDYSERTGGAFDITVKPLVDLWSKAKKANKLPGEGELKDALERVGYKNIVLDEAAHTILFKKDGMGIDLGGAAKGYATDRAIRLFKDSGIDSALVTSGGDMYCLGKRSAQEPWRVGIRHPRIKGRIFLEISLKERAISTSGDYERYFILYGKRYSHIIDPRTGYPIGDDIVSASVISADSTTSDILATAMCIMGEKGFGMIRDLGGMDAILVKEEAGRLTAKMSKDIRKRYDISQEKL